VLRFFQNYSKKVVFFIFFIQVNPRSVIKSKPQKLSCDFSVHTQQMSWQIIRRKTLADHNGVARIFIHMRPLPVTSRHARHFVN